MKSVVIAGDLVWDNNLVEHPAAPETHHEPFAKTVAHQRAGGAWYLESLVRIACRDLIDDAGVRVVGPRVPGNDASRSGIPAGSAHAIWAPFSRREGDGKAGRVWRIAKFLGCQRPELPAEADCLPIVGETESPDLVLLDDLCLGFSDHEELWPECIRKADGLPSVILKLSSSPDSSPLFQHLRNTLADRLTVVTSARLLRLRGAAISQALSWDRTIEETVEEFEIGRSRYDLACCRRVIVHFRTAGAVSFTRCRLQLGPPRAAGQEQVALSRDSGAGVLSDRGQFERFLYHPDELEGTWEAIRPGSTFGTASILTAAMARYELAPHDFPLCVALGRGLAAARACHEIGGGNEETPFASDAAHEEIDKRLHPDIGPDDTYPALGFFTAFPHQVLSTAPMKRQSARESNLLEDLAGFGAEYMAAKAMEVVLRGADKALEAAPKAHYGKYSTVDREEIERINCICRLLKAYLENPRETRPLSIAVFGPPGSGKSFAIKQLAEQMFGERRDPLEFNLSQFGDDGIERLREAFHQVHDATVKAQVPLVFWDEFDADGLKWLKHFLAPMQDGEFHAGGHIHPLAKALFVFAGGTKPSFERFDVLRCEDSPQEEISAFIAAKGPDFVSRLRGFVNIKGPNPVSHSGCDKDNGQNDPAHLIRRAMLLRSAIQRLHGHLIDARTGLAAISTSVIRGFLRAEKFFHGARSLEAVVAGCDLRSSKHFGAADLPPAELLRLHVTSDFLDRVKEGELESLLLEKLAQAIHAAYLREAGEDESDPRRRPYSQLSEENKECNRAAARVTQAKLHEAGYRVERRDQVGQDGDAWRDLDPSARHRLLEIEHDRWMREKLLAGFEWAATARRSLCLNPDIARFEDVPPEHQRYDEAIVEAIVEVLSSEGYCLVRIAE